MGHDWNSYTHQEPEGLTGYLDDAVSSASGRATPGLRRPLAANATFAVAFGHAQTVGRIPQVPNFGAHVAGRPFASAASRAWGV